MTEPEEKAINVPPVTLYTAAAMIIIHLLLIASSQDTVNWLYRTLAFSTDSFAAFLSEPTGAGFVPVFVTLNGHLFLHHDFFHLLLNAFMLLAFGSLIERLRGPAIFILLFLCAGWIGAMGEYLAGGAEAGSFLYGASGSVFGMMGAYVWIMMARSGAKKAWSFAAAIMGINLVIGISPLGNLLTGGDANISWAAHLAGFLAGLVIYKLLPRSPAI